MYIWTPELFCQLAGCSNPSRVCVTDCKREGVNVGLYSGYHGSQHGEECVYECACIVLCSSSQYHIKEVKRTGSDMLEQMSGVNTQHCRHKLSRYLIVCRHPRETGVNWLAGDILSSKCKEERLCRIEDYAFLQWAQLSWASLKLRVSG